MAFEQSFFFTHVVAPFHHAHEDILLSLRFGHSVAIAEAVLEYTSTSATSLVGTYRADCVMKPCTGLHSPSSWRGNIPSPPAAQSPSISPRRVSSPHHSTRSSGLTTRMCARGGTRPRRRGTGSGRCASAGTGHPSRSRRARRFLAPLRRRRRAQHAHTAEPRPARAHRRRRHRPPPQRPPLRQRSGTARMAPHRRRWALTT